ncbi:MAG TPA: glycosyltransferase family 4 protein [Gemmatimonadaceae bacterium]|nr:glycosyltransferase family 4 protein [Gemmatimonadaceae bacterium]
MRVFFVNSGILGHASVARVVGGAVASRADFTAVPLNLSEGLTTRERVVRRVMCVGPTTPASMVSGLTLARWRREMYTGHLAAGRIARAERAHGAADVLHFHTQATAFASVRRMRRTPSIVSIDITQRLASVEVPAGFRRWQYAACAARDRTVFRAARAIVATSRWAVADLARELPECADRVHVMPYPVPLDGFDAAWGQVRAARQGQPRVLFMGGDFPRKGGWNLLDAWRTANLGEVAQLRVVTDWPLTADRLPPGAELRSGIRSYTPEWFALWREADIFVLPTTGEAFGMVFQEAAAAGLPSIGTNLNAIPELVVPGETGMLVPVGDVRALAEALRHLIDRADVRRAMGAAARHRIEGLCAPNAYAERLVQLVHDVKATAAAGSA